MMRDQASKLPMRLCARRLAGRNPGGPEQKASSDQPRAVRLHPPHQVGMPKAAAQPRAIDLGVEADADDPSSNLARELRIVAGGDPDAADRDADNLGDAENSVLPIGRGESGGESGGIDLVVDVVDHRHGGHLTQLGGDPLAPFFVIVAGGHHRDGAPGDDGGDDIDHEAGAGSGLRLLDEVKRRRPIDHGANETEQEQHYGMGALGLRDEGKLAEKIIEDERCRLRDVLFCRSFREWTEAESPAPGDKGASPPHGSRAR